MLHVSDRAIVILMLLIVLTIVASRLIYVHQGIEDLKSKSVPVNVPPAGNI